MPFPARPVAFTPVKMPGRTFSVTFTPVKIPYPALSSFFTYIIHHIILFELH
jgi:hypothetical protein